MRNKLQKFIFVVLLTNLKFTHALNSLYVDHEIASNTMYKRGYSHLVADYKIDIREVLQIKVVRCVCMMLNLATNEH